MRRNVGGVEVNEAQPLVITQTRSAENLTVFWNAPAARAGVDAGVPGVEAGRVSRVQRTRIDVEPLEGQTIRKPSLELYLAQMRVGVSRAIQRVEGPVLVLAQQIAVGGRRLTGARDVVVFGLARVHLGLLLQVPAVLPDIANPHRRLEW